MSQPQHDMLREYDLVHLKGGSDVIGLPAGTRGTVLVIYPDAPPAYEVEFVDDAGDSLGTFTMQEGDLSVEADERGLPRGDQGENTRQSG